MEEIKILTSSPRATEEAGYDFAKELKPGNIVLLTGELGAGKTAFTRGVAKRFDIKSRVISPTFVLVRKHKGKIDENKINLYHIDLYRLETINDIKTLGLDDIFEDENGIFLIEWGEKQEGLNADFEVKIDIKNEKEREINIKKRKYEQKFK